MSPPPMLLWLANHATDDAKSVSYLRSFDHAETRARILAYNEEVCGGGTLIVLIAFDRLWFDE